jgi:hypothetical protein
MHSETVVLESAGKCSVRSGSDRRGRKLQGFRINSTKEQDGNATGWKHEIITHAPQTQEVFREIMPTPGERSNTIQRKTFNSTHLTLDENT